MQQGLPVCTWLIYHPFIVFMNASYNTCPFKKYASVVFDQTGFLYVFIWQCHTLRAGSN